MDYFNLRSLISWPFGQACFQPALSSSCIELNFLDGSNTCHRVCFSKKLPKRRFINRSHYQLLNHYFRASCNNFWLGTNILSKQKHCIFQIPCILVASILQLIGSVLAFQGKQETKTSNRKRLLATVYLASVILVLANINHSFARLLSPHSSLHQDQLCLRQTILGSVGLLFCSCSHSFRSAIFEG